MASRVNPGEELTKNSNKRAIMDEERFHTRRDQRNPHSLPIVIVAVLVMESSNIICFCWYWLQQGCFNFTAEPLRNVAVHLTTLLPAAGSTASTYKYMWAPQWSVGIHLDAIPGIATRPGNGFPHFCSCSIPITSNLQRQWGCSTRWWPSRLMLQNNV